MSFFKVALFSCVLGIFLPVNNYATESATAETSPTLMNVLSEAGLHDFKDERWNAYLRSSHLYLKLETWLSRRLYQSQRHTEFFVTTK